MKEITIISGKGGTGKTSITASFASLAKNKIIADCDVDAADLHIISQPVIKHREEFSGGKIAYIQNEKCTQCGKCLEVCHFDAISDNFIVDPISCEGCSVCVHFCPVEAIDFISAVNGEWYISDTRFGTLVHAKLGIAEENSGKLVTLVRRKAKEIAKENNYDYIIIDGAPGVGCPVISSITGANAVLIVTEPTISGMHDLQRVAQLSSEHFNLPTAVCINKYDLNTDMSNRIEKYCQESDISFLGKIPYDTVVTEAMVARKSIVEHSDGHVAQAIKEIWGEFEEMLK